MVVFPLSFVTKIPVDDSLLAGILTYIFVYVFTPTFGYFTGSRCLYRFRKQYSLIFSHRSSPSTAELRASVRTARSRARAAVCPRAALPRSGSRRLWSGPCPAPSPARPNAVRPAENALIPLTRLTHLHPAIGAEVCSSRQRVAGTHGSGVRRQ